MSYNFDASNDFDSSLDEVNILLSFAGQEMDSGNESNRVLFLKLSVVHIVTKFQVFVESILEEFHYELKNSNKRYEQIPLHLRLNSIRLYTKEKVIHESLTNPSSFSTAKLEQVREISMNTLGFCSDTNLVGNELKFETKFPMGKTGNKELTKLFKQINGEDIFMSAPFDKDKLNEILYRRHVIIHEDVNPQVTETTIREYKIYLLEVVSYVDNYLIEFI